MEYVRQRKRIHTNWRRASLFYLGCAILTTRMALGADSVAVASIVDYCMPLSIHRATVIPAAIGFELHKNDTIMVFTGGFATLVFKDGAVQKFDGPIVITLASKNRPQEGLLGKLASGLASIIFPSQSEREKARLAVRGPTSPDTPSLTIPVLIYPPHGTTLMTAPDHLEWLPINGATSYTVFLYDQNHLVWQERTQNISLRLSVDTLGLRSGESYSWAVQVDLGHSSLRSEQSDFSLIDTLGRNKIAQTVREINDSNLETRLATLLKLNLYQNHNLLVEEYREVEALLERSHQDYVALLVKAQLCEEMNMYQEAAACYHKALRQ